MHYSIKVEIKNQGDGTYITQLIIQKENVVIYCLICCFFIVKERKDYKVKSLYRRSFCKSELLNFPVTESL